MVSTRPRRVYGGGVFYWRRHTQGVTVAISDRDGGASAGAYAGLNLGGHVGDDPAAVMTNRTRLGAGLGLDPQRLVFMDQCHGGDVAVVEERPEVPPSVDALVTTTPGLALAALVADCTPVLLADPQAGVVAAVHAGRPGMVAGVVPHAIAAMRDLGARSVTAVVGPSVCPRCYEVPLDLREAAAAVVPESRAVSWTGTPALDVAAGVVAQLVAGGVSVEWVPGCAREDSRLFSYRRDGRTGRYAGVVFRDPRPGERR